MQRAHLPSGLACLAPLLLDVCSGNPAAGLAESLVEDPSQQWPPELLAIAVHPLEGGIMWK